MGNVAQQIYINFQWCKKEPEEILIRAKYNKFFI